MKQEEGRRWGGERFSVSATFTTSLSAPCLASPSADTKIVVVCYICRLVDCAQETVKTTNEGLHERNRQNIKRVKIVSMYTTRTCKLTPLESCMYDIVMALPVKRLSRHGCKLMSDSQNGFRRCLLSER